MSKLLILQFIAHILADYYFQTNRWCEKKDNDMNIKIHLVHVLIVFVSSWILSFSLGFIFYSLIITALHFLLDLSKSLINRKFKKNIFFIDQLLHLTIVFVTVYVYEINNKADILEELTGKQLYIFMALILCAKPSNIIIKNIMDIFNISIPKPNKSTNGLPNAGKLIGISERFIALILFILGQYQAVGFLIAAKSILRFKDTDTTNSEYVLTGTLLSFGITLFVALGIKLL